MAIDTFIIGVIGGRQIISARYKQDGNCAPVSIFDTEQNTYSNIVPLAWVERLGMLGIQLFEEAEQQRVEVPEELKQDLMQDMYSLPPRVKTWRNDCCNLT